MQTNVADQSAKENLWLVIHDRDDPMVLTQEELSRSDAADALRRLLQEYVDRGNHITPPEATSHIGTRHDVHDDDGWVATVWLAEEPVANDDGMLTAIASPGAKQRSHHTHPRGT
jgi:hypothetical protein